MEYQNFEFKVSYVYNSYEKATDIKTCCARQNNKRAKTCQDFFVTTEVWKKF